jgi:hypothetical protein
MELIGGNVHASVGAAEFLSRLLDQMPSSIATARTRDATRRSVLRPQDPRTPGKSRAGPGGDGAHVQALAAANGGRRYHEFARGWEAGELTYTRFHWKQEHRFVAVRRAVALELEEIQQRLFTFKKVDLPPSAGHQPGSDSGRSVAFLRHCGGQELLRRELTYSYAMSKIPTRNFWANAAYLEGSPGPAPWF